MIDHHHNALHDDADDHASREMFASVVGEKVRREGARTLVTISLGLHILAVLALLFRGAWVVDKLVIKPQDAAVVMAIPESLPRLPAARTPAKLTPRRDKAREVRPRATRSAARSAEPNPTSLPLEPRKGSPDVPLDFDIDDTIEVDTPDSITGLEGGAPGSLAGGTAAGRAGSLNGTGLVSVLGGEGGGGLDRADAIGAPPEPAGPMWIPQLALEQRRTSGNASAVPEKGIKQNMVRVGKDQLVFVAKVCASLKGDVTRVKLVQSSGYPAHDRRLTARIKQWKHRPYRVRGQARPVCANVTLVYRQRLLQGKAR